MRRGFCVLFLLVALALASTNALQTSQHLKAKIARARLQSQQQSRSHSQEWMSAYFKDQLVQNAEGDDDDDDDASKSSASSDPASECETHCGTIDGIIYVWMTKSKCAKLGGEYKVLPSTTVPYSQFGECLKPKGGSFSLSDSVKYCTAQQKIANPVVETSLKPVRRDMVKTSDNLNYVKYKFDENHENRAVKALMKKTKEVEDEIADNIGLDLTDMQNNIDAMKDRVERTLNEGPIPVPLRMTDAIQEAFQQGVTPFNEVNADTDLPLANISGAAPPPLRKKATAQDVLNAVNDAHAKGVSTANGLVAAAARALIGPNDANGRECQHCPEDHAGAVAPAMVLPPHKTGPRVSMEEDEESDDEADGEE